MRALRTAKLDVTTNAGGAGSATTTTPILGWLYSILWIDGTFDNGVDPTFTVEPPNEAGLARNLFVVANADDDKMYYPRVLEHLDTDGTALTTHTHPIIDGYVKLTVAAGGNVKTGGAVLFYFIE